ALGTGTTLTASTATFNGTVAGGGNSLAVSGNAVFGVSAADTVTRLRHPFPTRRSSDLTNTVTSSGIQTYSGAVALGTGTTLTASTAEHNAKVAAGGNSVARSGNAEFGDAAADTVTGLSTLSVSGTTAINTNTVTSSGIQ